MIYEVEYRKIFIDLESHRARIGPWIPDKKYKRQYYAMALCFENAIRNTNRIDNEFTLMQSRIILKEN